MKAKLKAAERQVWKQYRKFGHYGIGPSLGFPIGHFNRILARVEANPQLEVIRTILYRDITLEDFFITVLTQDEREVRL